MNFLRNENGITLIEVLLSLSLVALLITAFTGTFVTGLRSEAEMNNKLNAVKFSESILEYLESNPELIKNGKIDSSSLGFLSEYNNYKLKIDKIDADGDIEDIDPDFYEINVSNEYIYKLAN